MKIRATLIRLLGVTGALLTLVGAPASALASSDSAMHHMKACTHRQVMMHHTKHCAMRHAMKHTK
jgi:hypothetical protein